MRKTSPLRLETGRSVRTARPGFAASKPARDRKAAERPPQLQGWATSDEDEIALRRWRGRTEIEAIEALEPKQSLFGTFRIRSDSGGVYEVEIREFDGRTNSCGCIDHRVNGLGTCKHIEGALEVLRQQHAAASGTSAAGRSTRVEIYLDRRQTPRPAIAWPEPSGGPRSVHEWLRPFLTTDGQITDDPRTVGALLAALPLAPAAVRRAIRISRHFGPWLEREQCQRSRAKSREKFLADVETGKASFDLVKLPLLPYQREGMLHLAFGERALLADEMGLGKTVQAIAACELLARRKKVGRVLIVCPASLKAEWEEQIARFTDRPARSVFGAREQRLAAYGAPVFFTIVNYEQVLVDADDINRTLAPDVVILDEAQRIKNWQTKTAKRVKQLCSPYAFVLTGTPLENRIDELYSIVQYLDPELVGPLFRFNRDYYSLDERGRPVDYKNLTALRDRVAPVMLRRRKADVEGQLPGRTVTNYFVAMLPEQRVRYEDYKGQAARLMAIAQRRPLLPKEFERLQMFLACMRMICDTPAILDPTCRVCPKLEELERILGELLEEPGRKIIVFSEWERMLQMIRDLAGEMGIEVAWHTGSVPQQRRRAEIMRFKEDPTCRLFLSTDSGSVGLNLQTASAVVNVDLPWNPAKLEQRIARAWRKGQTRGVTVVNLVCEDSIEHGMLHLLGSKQALADGLLDGQGDLAALKMPSGRAAMIERMQALLQEQVARAAPAAAPVVASREQTTADELLQRHGERALYVEARTGADGRNRLLAVLDLDRQALKTEAKRLASSIGGDGGLEVIDRSTWLTLCRLRDNGIVQFAGADLRVLHRAPGLAETADEDEANATRTRVGLLRGQADRALRKAGVLAIAGFFEDVVPVLTEAICHAACAMLAEDGRLPAGAAVTTAADLQALKDRKSFPPLVAAAIEALAGAGERSEGSVAALVTATAAAVAVLGHNVSGFDGDQGALAGRLPNLAGNA